jgi:hypothetical protein
LFWVIATGLANNLFVRITFYPQFETINQDSIFDFSLITVKEYFFPVDAAALETAVVESSKFLCLVELKI